MKSKSFDLKQISAEKSRHNKTFDFVGLYKSASETNRIPEKRKSSEILNKESPLIKLDTPKRERSPNKNKRKPKNEPVEISQINIDGFSLNSSLGGSTPLDDSKVTSTPRATSKPQPQVRRVKSIMKNTSANEDDLMDGSKQSITSKPKKRNKSVSFMLDDNEEVVMKKTKSDNSLVKNNESATPTEKHGKAKRKIIKKDKKDQSEKENKASDVNLHVENQTKQKKTKVYKRKTQDDTPANNTPNTQMQVENQDKKKKLTKTKNHKVELNAVHTESESNNNNQTAETKNKKIKKKKRHAKTSSNEEGEPVVKARKKDVKPDVIAEDLENLSIGDNAHTLSSLLDEMTVVDKEKRKKNILKRKNEKKTTLSSSDTTSDKDEKKEKVKWNRRKWNKDKKGNMNTESLATSVIVENLPISIMLTYKKLLTEQFGKYGLISKIGIAEVYPTEESKPVFTTTIHFYSDGAAKQALEEDGTVFEGSRIRVKRPLPATETTLVLRTYAELSEQGVSSLLAGVGKIRSIRNLVKGKKAMSTAFVEFDGPESVERAMKKATNAKIGGKKVHISKFEVRKKQKKPPNEDNGDEGGSEDSND